jgi:hypothetical protein
MREIHNLQEVIDDCLCDVPVVDPKVDEIKRKYDFAYARLQKSCASDFYLGQALAYKDVLSQYGVKV